MENEIMVNEELVNAGLEEICNTENSGKGIAGKLAVGAVLVGAGAIAAIVYKNRAKFENRKIEKLRKKGYVIYKEDEAFEAETTTFEEVEDVE